MKQDHYTQRGSVAMDTDLMVAYPVVYLQQSSAHLESTHVLECTEKVQAKHMNGRGTGHLLSTYNCVH